MLGFIRITVDLELPGRAKQLLWTDAIRFELPTITVPEKLTQVSTDKLFAELQRRIDAQEDDD